MAHTRSLLVASALIPLVAGLTWADAGSRRPVDRLPQLSPATPAALAGTCEALLQTLAGLPNTQITAATTVPTGGLALAGQPVPDGSNHGAEVQKGVPRADFHRRNRMNRGQGP